MKVHDLQTEMATHGYGPALVKYWEIIKEEHKDFLPHSKQQWIALLRASKDIRQDLHEEAVNNLLSK